MAFPESSLASTTPEWWLFDGSWGVDVAVSTPAYLSALVEKRSPLATSFAL